jgi:spore germination protein YaaH
LQWIAAAKRSTASQWFFKNWSSANDYPALAQSGDFITVMSYDQHTSLTTPGPIASAAWVEKIILHLLETIPPTKISLGLDINTNHIRSIREGFVYATAKPYHLGKSTQVWSIEILNEDKKLISINRLTMAVLEGSATANRFSSQKQ